jgi:hypothetical protein
MNCVCSIDSCDEPSQEISTTSPVAKKHHRCGECGHDIQPGEKYERYVAIGLDGFFTAKTCSLCVEVRDCFCCSYYFGRVYEHIHDNVWDLKIGALDSLTKPARDKFFENVDLQETDD